MDLPRKKLVILGIFILLAVILLFFYYFKGANLFNKSSELPPPLPTDSPSKETFSCPVAKELCSKAQDLYQGSTFIGVGFSLTPGTKVRSSIAGSAFFTSVADRAQKILNHSKVVVTGKGAQKGYVFIYEFFSPKVSDKSSNRNVNLGEEIGELGPGSFPQQPPYNGMNLIIFPLKNGAPYKVQASNFKPI